VVSDEEDNDDDDSLDVSKVAYNHEMRQDLDELEKISLPKLPFVVKEEFVSSGNLKNQIVKDDDLGIMPNDDNPTLPFHKRTNAHQEDNRLPIMRSHSTGSRWLDVLDKTVDKDTHRHVIKYQDSDDLDDENDHLEMMKALRRRSSLQTDKTLQKAHHVSSERPNITYKATRVLFEDDEAGDTVLVSDDENEASLLGSKTRPRSTLYPDEVEV
jgi:hypothetical protein